MTKGFAKEIGEGFKDKNKLTSQVARHLAKAYDNGRNTKCIHPSEASHENWCPRASYYTITGVEAEQKPRKLAMEIVFETGHEAHTKWQRWLGQIGVLEGNWSCPNCDYFGASYNSPNLCVQCGTELDYAEVPLGSEEYLLGGHADGIVRKADGHKSVLEIKTIGVGTVRYEAPALLERCSYHHVDTNGNEHVGVDWVKLWQNIKHPFAAHIRQAMLYCLCLGLDEVTFIYEPKFVTSPPKEFVVKYNRDFIEDILEECLKVKKALQKGYPPKRPLWADEDTTCHTCPYVKECYGHNRPDRPDRTEPVTGNDGVEETGAAASPPTRIRIAEFTQGTY